MSRRWIWGAVIGRAVLVLLASFGSSGCFFYDSSYGQQKKAQRHEAERLAPHKLERQGTPGSVLRAQRTLSLRIYATPTYQASIVDWQQQFQDQLDCANTILAPDFGVSLKMEDVKTFRPHASEDKLDPLLQELSELDAAKETDLVVGLVSAQPHFATSADELGRARMLGQHLVLRAMSDAHEYEAIQSAFSELPEEERRKLYRVRKRHKLCVTLLHEFAHNFGVPHERDPTSLMNSRYNTESKGFSDSSAAFLRMSLAARVPGQPVVVDAPLARSLAEVLRQSSQVWEPQTRDSVLALLASVDSTPALAARPLPNPVASRPAPLAPTPALVTAPIAGLDSAEQRTLELARAELSAGQLMSARAMSERLWAKYPNLPAVQELRCNVAMAIGGDAATLDAACAALSPFGTAR